MPATMNLLRQTGVLLASSGLVVYWTLRLRSSAFAWAGPAVERPSRAPHRAPVGAGAGADRRNHGAVLAARTA